MENEKETLLQPESEKLGEETEGLTQEIALEQTEPVESAESAETEFSADNETPAEDAEEQAPAKKAKKEPRRIFMNGNTLEWMSTVSFCGIILYLGYLFGSAAQDGASGLAMVKSAFATSWYADAFLLMLLGFGLLASGLAKKKGNLCLGIPAAVYAGMTGYNLYRTGVVVTAMISVLIQIKSNETYAAMMDEVLKQFQLPIYALQAGLYLFQMAAIVTFVLLLFGRCNRWVHVVFVGLWQAASIGYTVLELVGSSFSDLAAPLMRTLAVLALGLVMLLPAVAGKRVPRSQLAELRAADEAAQAAEKQKKNGKAAQVSEEAETATGEVFTETEEASAQPEAVAAEVKSEEPAAQAEPQSQDAQAEPTSVN